MIQSLNKGISILGCGWYGLAVAEKLAKNGYTVKGSTTTAEKQLVLKESSIIPYMVNFQETEEDFDPDFFNSEILIICIPPKRSTAEQHTFLAKIERIANAASHSSIQNVIFISSTSVYGDLNAEVDENSTPVPDTDSGKAILKAESLLKENTNFKTTIIRFGGLFGPNRNPGRFFAGKSAIPNGQAPVNLIHLSDCIGITLKILEKSAFGYTYNACSAEHPSRAVFYTNAAIHSGMDPPQFKDELLNWKQVNSIMLNEKLNYNFEVKLNAVVRQ
ncbi:MAG: SDR family oxidoreductase [Pedobacter sp.]|uniref:SDR family oxidoreductase n=1 Tax=Pedobacter sp. TaxID=1411316 RepID=UPI003393110E